MALGSAGLIKKRFRQRFGIRAPRVTVRTHIPWYLWGGLFVIFCFLLIALASWLYESGGGRKVGGGAAEFEQMLAKQHELQSEVSRLRQIVDTGESKYRIEQTAGQQLARQVKVLESENASLKEDLAFFEGLVPGGGAAKDGGPKITRFRVEPDLTVGQYRYRMLVVQSSGKAGATFRGGLQLVIKLQQGWKDAMIVLPEAGGADRRNFDVDVKYFQRIEGGFSVPAGSVVRSVEARLLQNGSVLSHQVQAL
jgi:hypothetical protein